MRENKFQADLIADLRCILPGCIVLKNDPNYLQGIPDLLVMFEDRWAALEVKASIRSPLQPNQRYYLDVMDRMSFATIICPENKEEVLNALQLAFGVSR